MNNKLSKIIGIISYLPNEEKIRRERLNKLTTLIKDCNRIFNLPIIIIAQNWQNVTLNEPNLIVYRYEDKLGIVGARRELRRIFLLTSCDYLIMLDDDCQIFGKNGDEYLKQIDNHPNCFCEFKLTLLKLFAISRYIFEQQDYLDNFNPELQEGFEDRVFVNILRNKFPNNRYIFTNTGLLERSTNTRDPNSTWYKNQDVAKMRDNTLKYISDLEREYKNH